MTGDFDAAAGAYDRRVGRWSRLYIPAVVAAAGIQPGDRVLDVATGTGEAALAATAVAAPGGWVLGCDISLPMLRVARAKVARRSVSLAVMDAQALGCRDGSVDAIICQLGLMFVPDVARALREFRRVLRPDRSMAACVWSAPARAPLVGVLSEVLAHHAPEKRAELMRGTSLGDASRLLDLVVSAGFRDVAVRAETHPAWFASFGEYWEPIAAGGSPGAAVYMALPEATRKLAEAEARARVQPYADGDQLRLDNEALIVSGRR